MPIIGGRQIGVRGLGFQGAGKPNAPTSVSATDVGTARAYNNGAATVTWVAPSSNGAPITSYSVLSSPGGYTATTSSTSVQVTGLQSNTAYTFTVTATNAVGTSDASSASSSITATTVPQAPTIGTATGGNASATVTYTAGATGGKTITAFTAISSPSSITGTGASPITVSGLTNGTAYTFTVTATNANGTSAASSASNSVTPIQPTYAVVGHGGSPFISAYRFTTSGFGTKYSNPATLPTSALGDVQFHPSAQAVLCAVNFGGYTLTAYGWSDSGFGTKYADTTNQNGGTAGLGCSFNPAGTVAAGANTGSPDFPAGFSAYPFSVSTGFGTMYSGPATKPFNNSTANDVAFNPAGTVVAWAVTNTGGSTVFAYPFSFSTGYGTKYADPSPGFATSAGTISFNSSSVVIGSSISPYLQAYPFSSGFGTKYADPATMPGTRVVGVAFNPAGTQVALALQDGIKLSAYPFSSGFGTKYSDYPGSGPTDAAQDVAFTSDGLTLGVAFNLSPYIRAYRFSASGFGSEYSQPASIPANNANGISFVTAA